MSAVQRGGELVGGRQDMEPGAGTSTPDCSYY